MLQIRESGFLQQDNVTNVGLGRNAFQSGAWSYIADGYAQMLNLESDGAFKFFQAGSGTANNTVSFSQAMTLDASGNLLVGCTAVPSASNAGFAVRDLNNGWIHTSYDSTNTRTHHNFSIQMAQLELSKHRGHQLYTTPPQTNASRTTS